MKIIFTLIILSAIIFAGWHKADAITPDTFPATEEIVISVDLTLLQISNQRIRLYTDLL